MFSLYFSLDGSTFADKPPLGSLRALTEGPDVPPPPRVVPARCTSLKMEVTFICTRAPWWFREPDELPTWKPMP